MITLPTQKINATSQNPKFLVIFGKPKSGKSTCAAALDNNLILDLENGYAHLSAMKIIVNSLEDLSQVVQLVSRKNKEVNGYVYEYITIDNGTKLEEMCKTLALELYQKTPMGKNYNDDILKLANGGGYAYLREAFFKVLNMFKALSKHLILITHVKDSAINKEGKEMTELSIDLAGKISRLVAADADALGYMYREKNKTILSFDGGGDFIAEARPLHLRGKQIVIADSDENGIITTYWDKIYINEGQDIKQAA